MLGLVVFVTLFGWEACGRPLGFYGNDGTKPPRSFAAYNATLETESVAQVPISEVHSWMSALAEDLKNEFEENRKDAAKKLIKIGAPSVPYVIAILKAEEAWGRSSAARRCTGE
jgi:hypothetical protein